MFFASFKIFFTRIFMAYFGLYSAQKPFFGAWTGLKQGRSDAGRALTRQGKPKKE